MCHKILTGVTIDITVSALKMEVAVLSQMLGHDFSSELNGVTSEEVVTLNQNITPSP
jgi:hypothetical protein